MVWGRVGASFQRREIDVTVAGCRSESSVASFLFSRGFPSRGSLRRISFVYHVQLNLIFHRERALIVNQVSFKRIV